MTARLISSIRVEQLFGLYTYDVPEADVLSDAAILYGDNGVGKSTLLRLVFHLLSAAKDRSHRTTLYEADFALLRVALSSGVVVSARFVQESPSKLLVLEIFKAGAPIAAWDYRPRHGEARFLESHGLTVEVDEHGQRVVRSRQKPSRKTYPANVQQGEVPFLAALQSNVPTLFILNADRRLDSDAVADPSDEVELRRVMQYGEPRRIGELVVRSREIALSQALSAAARWLSRKAVIGANQGTMNVHSVYGDVLRRLLSPTAQRDLAKPQGTIAELQAQLALIDSQTLEHSRYELATHLSTNDFKKALSGRSTKKRDLAADLLTPYVKSIESRLAAIEPTYKLIDRFVTLLNGLLRDKTISFKLSQGFAIQNRLGVPLTPAQLSSGEQQLLLLFCCVLTARDRPSVFMIDEPELSLNIKWQRLLVQSLLDITSEASIQFVLASHSIELLAQHRSRVVKLVNQA